MKLLRPLALLFLMALAACTEQTIATMTLRSADAGYQPAENLRGALSVGTVTGDRLVTSPWTRSTPHVGDEVFAEALRRSLAVHDLLDASGQRLRVDAALTSLPLPLFGLDVTITSEVRYRVVEIASGLLVFDQPITASYTTTMGDSWRGVRRMEFAIAGTMRANIAAFIAALNEAVRRRSGAAPPG